jgi:hypothetical protein
MFLSRRRRLFVDFKLQGALLLHTTIYWFYCLLSVVLIGCCWVVFVQRPGTSTELFRTLWHNLGPALIGSLLLLPLVLMDCLRLSNRFAGPMVRLHRAMEQLANGEPVKPVKLRDGDFWLEFADNFNRVAAQRGAADGTQGKAEQEPAGVCSCLVTASSPSEQSIYSDLTV